MFDVKSIEHAFIQSGISFKKNNNIDIFKNYLSDLPDSIIEWLRLMGTTIKFNVSDYGVAKLYLLSQQEMFDEYLADENVLIRENNCFVVGSGPNGDLICVDMDDGNIVFVSHDDLWDFPDEDFANMSIKLDINLQEYLNMVLAEENYPADIFMAEKYIADKS